MTVVMIAVPVSQTAGHPLRRKDVLKVILMAERSCGHKYKIKMNRLPAVPPSGHDYGSKFILPYEWTDE